ncbi:MAG: acetate--CoA ligase family protein [Candidatus Methanosuratincola verstraetei]|jgi:acyl-CoA synthetase (NDP forming)|uniref:Acetyl-CoA synthetase n=1 Tax=Methanosuratincola subterraneus TaxID=2593994 RepID=A0A444L875_METS7|nr:MAG: acetyl-CoA synthetase [Candidatus Methanosuratincola subterraneus]
MGDSLEHLFSPRSVCVIGASRDPEAWGHVLLRNLLNGGFRGRIYAVNPRANEVLGIPCHRSVFELPEEIDLAVIALPSGLVYDAVVECGEKGAKYAIVVSAGFGESGRSDLERKVVQAARARGMRIIGPNCMGIYSSHSDLVSTFTSLVPPRGEISFVSQSGAVGTTVLAWAKEHGVGFSKFVSIGNESDLSIPELLEYFETDDSTKVIALYLESVKDGRRLVSSLSSCTLKKPVVAMKVGVTSAGAAAASSHTGAIAVEDKIIDGVFRQYSVIRARDPAELFRISFAFSSLPIPSGRSAAVVTTGGGWGIECADALEMKGISLPPLPREVFEVADATLPGFWSKRNPIDMVASPDPFDYSRILEAVLKSPEFDMAFLLGFGTIGSIAMPSLIRSEIEAAKSISEIVRATNKPLFVVDMLGPSQSAASRALIKAGIPVFPSSLSAAEAASAMVRYREFRRRKSSRT